MTFWEGFILVLLGISTMANIWMLAEVLSDKEQWDDDGDDEDSRF